MLLSPVASRYGMEYVIALTNFAVDQDREDPLVNILPHLIISHLATTVLGTSTGEYLMAADLAVCSSLRCDYGAMVPLMNINPNLHWIAARKPGYSIPTLGKFSMLERKQHWGTNIVHAPTPHVQDDLKTHAAMSLQTCSANQQGLYRRINSQHGAIDKLNTQKLP